MTRTSRYPQRKVRRNDPRAIGIRHLHQTANGIDQLVRSVSVLLDLVSVWVLEASVATEVPPFGSYSVRIRV